MLVAVAHAAAQAPASPAEGSGAASQADQAGLEADDTNGMVRAPRRSDDEPVVVPLGPDGLPDPTFWMYDESGHARDWLDKPLMDPEDLAARLPAYEATLADHGIHLDVEAREVLVRGATIGDARTLAYPVEYLVVTEMGQTHEALVLVRSQPSVIDACLRALELEPGGPTVVRIKDPLPPEEDIEAGLVSPWQVTAPHGPLIEISMGWVDDGGQRHEASLESLIIDARTGEVLEEKGWIYTGSSYANYRRGRGHKRWYKADMEGDVVAIYLAGVEVCVFERNSLDGLVDGYYFPHPEIMPPPGTPVTVRFKLTDDVVLEAAPVEGPTWSEDGLSEAAEEPDPDPETGDRSGAETDDAMGDQESDKR